MSRDALVAIGGCLVFLGFVLRGLARGHGRTAALRKQHDLAASEPDPENQPDAFDRHFEKWLPTYGALFIVGGFALIGYGFLR